MIKCPICLEVIPHERVMDAFIFTFGRVIDGCFYGDKSIYYHKECVEFGKIHN